jgi:sigma-B regulation protein RsbU (phosphoserine phosphatase)
MLDTLFQQQTQNVTIMVVEDTQSERYFIVGLLTNMGLNVICCDSAEQAIEQYPKHAIDIVISDWRMPGLTGPELCLHLKKSPSPPYIILLTANNLAEHIVTGIESGADDFVSKPFIPSVLKVRILAAARAINLQRRLSDKNHKLNTALNKEHAYLEQVKNDLKSAAQLQGSHLPSSGQLANLWSLAARFKPAQELAGDIFQCFNIDQEHIGFYLLDVTGHGIAASMQSFTLAQQLSCNSCNWESLNPALIVNQLNRDFEDPENTGRFATLILGVANTFSGEVKLVLAGHPQPILLDENGASLMALDAGIPLGIDNQHQYQNNVFSLNSHQHLMLYSDGLYECRHPRFGEFGLCRLIKTCDQAHQLEPEALLHHLCHSTELWQQKIPQDDLSMMIISSPELTPKSTVYRQRNSADEPSFDALKNELDPRVIEVNEVNVFDYKNDQPTLQQVELHD